MARVIIFGENQKLLPQAWLYGFLYTYRSTLMRPAYLLGEYGHLGWWYYFPLAMLFKTPVATLFAMLAAVLVSFKRITKPQAETLTRWNSICLMVPLVVYGLSAVTSHLNLGLRHVLPLYPFIYVMIGIGAARLRAARPGIFTPAAVLLGLGLIVETLAAFPHYISFFNAPSRPYRFTLLSDSNFDWGQDLPYVLRWQDQHPGRTLFLGYMGSVDPAFYGIRYVNIPGGFRMNPSREWPPSRPGVIAISATLLQGMNCPVECREYYAPLRERKPREVLGDTIYLYDWPLR
jgi:hypothetical protein